MTLDDALTPIADSNEISTLDVKLDEIPAVCRQAGDASHVVVAIDVVMCVGYNDGREVRVVATCDGRELAQYATRL